MLRPILTFTISMILCTIACATIWQAAVTDTLYHCTDSVGFDYFSGPHHWVHGKPAGHPGDFGDTIHPAWSLTTLTLLWLLFIAASVGISAYLTWLSARAKPPAHLQSPGFDVIPTTTQPSASTRP